MKIPGIGKGAKGHPYNAGRSVNCYALLKRQSGGSYQNPSNMHSFHSGILLLEIYARKILMNVHQHLSTKKDVHPIIIYYRKD